MVVASEIASASRSVLNCSAVSAGSNLMNPSQYSAFGTAAGYPDGYELLPGRRKHLAGNPDGCSNGNMLDQQVAIVCHSQSWIVQQQSRAPASACLMKNGINPYINSGAYVNTPYVFGSEDNDFAMLGELDFGVIYQMTCNTRLNFGYRGLGIAGIALAPNQIPYDFQDVREINQVNTDGSLILHGAYGGFRDVVLIIVGFSIEKTSPHGSAQKRKPQSKQTVAFFWFAP